MPRSKDRSRGELEKLRGLSFKEKLWYIWNYYNYIIIGTVIVIAVTISLLRSCYFSPDTVLNIAWESPYISTEELDTFEEALSNLVLDPDAGEIIETLMFYLAVDDIATASMEYERLIAMTAAGALDVFILNAVSVRAFSAMELLLPLDEILAEINERDPAVFDKISRETITAQYGTVYDDITGEPLSINDNRETTGIRITDTQLMNSLSLNVNEDIYLCVAISFTNKYHTLHTIMKLFTD